MEAARSFETLVSYYIITGCHNLKMEAERSSKMLVSYIITGCHNLKMEAAKSSETLVIYIITRCHMGHDLKDHDFNLHRRENLKF
jgi:hypothetical protein